jgi:hypothetical protein
MLQYRAVSSGFTFCSVETGLPGWAYRTRTGESVRELPDWIRVTTSPEQAHARRRRPFACKLRNRDLQLRPRFQQTRRDTDGNALTRRGGSPHPKLGKTTPHTPSRPGGSPPAVRKMAAMRLTRPNSPPALVRPIVHRSSWNWSYGTDQCASSSAWKLETSESNDPEIAAVATTPRGRSILMIAARKIAAIGRATTK